MELKSACSVGFSSAIVSPSKAFLYFQRTAHPPILYGPFFKNDMASRPLTFVQKVYCYMLFCTVTERLLPTETKSF